MQGNRKLGSLKDAFEKAGITPVVTKNKPLTIEQCKEMGIIRETTNDKQNIDRENKKEEPKLH